MTAKHILVVASTFPSHDNDPVPAFVKDQIIALKAHDPSLRFAVLAPHDLRSHTKDYTKHRAYDEYRFHYAWPRSAEQLAGRGIMPALKANPLNYLLIPFLFLGEFFALLKLTHKLKPDIIYAHWFTPQAINARLVNVFTGIPFVFTTHASDVDVWHKIPLLGHLVVQSNTRRAQGFTAVSRRSMEKMERFFSPSDWDRIKKRSQIIPMGVSLPDEPPAKRSSRGLTILFVGRLAEKKGVHYLLPAFAKFRQNTPEARLIIAGDGPWLDQLTEQARELNLGDSVEFPGYISGGGKWELIASADIYVVPSIIASDGDAEGLPVSLMEGLAYGKVCIATNESGADDIITDGKDGFLIPQKDANTLARALEKAAGLTAQERRHMTRAAKTTSKQFSWEVIAEKYSDFLFKKD